MRRVGWMLVATLAAAFVASDATAQQAAPAAKSSGPSPAASNGAELYASKTCVACHGKDAKTPILPEYPKLAGQSEAYMVQQIRDIKSGARSNGNTAAMKGVMHLVNDDEIKALAAYLSSLK